MPGIIIASPMTPKEYNLVYKKFMSEDNVYYVSEHRGSYNNSVELKDIVFKKPHLTLFPISITRFAAQEISNKLKKRNIFVNVHHILWIKPFKITKTQVKSLKNSKFGGIVLDDDYSDGVARSLAHRLNIKTDKKIRTLGLEDRSAGFSKSTDNLPPDEKRLEQFIKKILK